MPLCTRILRIFKTEIFCYIVLCAFTEFACERNKLLHRKVWNLDGGLTYNLWLNRKMFEKLSDFNNLEKKLTNSSSVDKQ